MARCGDGVVHEGMEECDDGNRNQFDDCPNDCLHWPLAVMAIVQGNEECDDGDLNGATPTVWHLCRAEGCGDGVVQEGEECDDANAVGTDGCTNQRLQLAPLWRWSRERWGRSLRRRQRRAPMTACSNCRLPGCGDAFVSGREACDDGNEDKTDDACLNTCDAARCGDRQIRRGFEVCDDGNENQDDACVNDCAVGHLWRWSTQVLGPRWSTRAAMMATTSTTMAAPPIASKLVAAMVCCAKRMSKNADDGRRKRR